MPSRRILSLWFPRLAAERVLRGAPGLAGQPLAVVAEARGALLLASLDAVAEARGLRRGMALGDARAICPGLVTRPEDPWREAAFLDALRRWAGRFSPWVARGGARGADRSTSPAARISSAARRGWLPGSRPRRRASASPWRSGWPTPSAPPGRWRMPGLGRGGELAGPRRRRHRPGGAGDPLAGREAELDRAGAGGVPAGAPAGWCRRERRSSTWGRCRWRRCGWSRARSRR